MGPDQTVELICRMLLEAMLLSAPLLIAAGLVSVLVSLVQTLTGIQEQTLTSVPRLIVVFTVAVLVLPWSVHRLVLYTLHLFTNLHRYFG
ncbi:MAG: flagellar biosynthetic protein FliQ [Acidobacteriota bacterium]|nr:flagellar biosynthetic protein FliQ [Acidobacteriota bacterium]